MNIYVIDLWLSFVLDRRRILYGFTTLNAGQLPAARGHHGWDWRGVSRWWERSLKAGTAQRSQSCTFQGLDFANDLNKPGMGLWGSGELAFLADAFNLAWWNTEQRTQSTYVRHLALGSRGHRCVSRCFKRLLLWWFVTQW